jgi:hypothetical protein
LPSSQFATGGLPVRTFAKITIFIVTLCLLSPLLAGVEPSPFTQDINKLGAVTNGLNSGREGVKKLLGMLPDPDAPGTKQKDAVVRFEEIDKQIYLLNVMTFSIVTKFLAAPSDDLYGDMRGEIVHALGMVRDASQGIGDVIIDTSLDWTDSYAPEIMQALSDMVDSAYIFATGTQKAINAIEAHSKECERANYLPVIEDCKLITTCQWVLETNGFNIIDEYCCCTEGGDIR